MWFSTQHRPSRLAQRLHHAIAAHGDRPAMWFSTQHRPSRLAQRLHHAIAAHGDRPAMLQPGKTVTYAQLGREAAAWTSRLLDHGAPLDFPVALLLPKGPDLVAALLGVIGAGGTYLVAEPEQDPEQTSRLLDGLLVGTRIDSPHGPPRLLRPAAPSPASTGPRTPNPAFALVRTSGTTGTPRGVLQSPVSLLHHIGHLAARLQFSPSSRLSWLAPPGVAATHSHLFGALLHGAALCPFDLSSSGISCLTSWLHQIGITHLHLTPSVLRAWLGAPGPLPPFPTLACIKLGGEPAHGSDVDLIRKRLSPVPEIFNGLGMTEANGNITLHRVRPREPLHGLLPVGRPAPGHRISITGPFRFPWAAPCAGEIVVQSRYLSQGFWPDIDRPTLRHPVLPRRHLPTGDLGIIEYGNLIHLGRIDRRISHRGHTLDLSTVEARLSEIRLLRHAAAFTDASVPGYRLALVAEPNTSAVRLAVRKALPGTLPVPPSRTAFFPSMPLTPGGKIDLAALRTHWPESNHAPAFTADEQPFRDVWKRVLGHEDFSPETTFFEAGGDSLAALQVLADLEQNHAIAASSAHFIRYPTIRSLCRAHNDGLLHSGSDDPGPTQAFDIAWVDLEPAGTSSPIFASPGGWTSDGELWLIAGLTSRLRSHHPMACTRTNLAHAFAEPPEDLGAVITPLLPRLLRSAPPILLGNCIGARIILALAARLEQAGHPVAQIILIDPPVPGRASRNRAGDAAPPKRVRRFYDVLKHPTTVDEIHVDHVICAESDPQLDLRRQTWEPRLRPGGRIHITPGDHQSCIREHQVRVANLLADILDTPQ